MTLEQIGALLGSAVLLYNYVRAYGSQQKIKKIESEFTNNGGKSLRDAVDRIEKGLYLDKQRLHAFLSESPYLMFECDKAGECVWVNKTYLEVTKRTLDEVLGTGWIMCINSLDRRRVYSEWLAAVEHGIHVDTEYTLVSSDGIKIPVEAKTTVLRNTAHTSEGFVGIIKIKNNSNDSPLPS